MELISCGHGQVERCSGNFLCDMGGAREMGGVEGFRSANGVVRSRFPCCIGRGEIIVRIWEAGCSWMFFYLLCVVLNRSGAGVLLLNALIYPANVNRFQGANALSFRFCNAMCHVPGAAVAAVEVGNSLCNILCIASIGELIAK